MEKQETVAELATSSGEVAVGGSSAARLVVVDVCNVGHSASPQRRFLSTRGVLVVMRQFIAQGHRVASFIPIVYKNSCPKVIQPELLSELQQLGLLAFTPARYLAKRGDDDDDQTPPLQPLYNPAFVMNYDDLYLLQHAASHAGIVISNDHFLDIGANTAYKRLWPTIKGRRLAVRFDNHGGFRLLGQEEWSSADWAAVLHAAPGDPDHHIVLKQRLAPPEQERLLLALDNLLARYPERGAPSPTAQLLGGRLTSWQPQRRRGTAGAYQRLPLEPFLLPPDSQSEETTSGPARDDFPGVPNLDYLFSPLAAVAGGQAAEQLTFSLCTPALPEVGLWKDCRSRAAHLAAEGLGLLVPSAGGGEARAPRLPRPLSQPRRRSTQLLPRLRSGHPAGWTSWLRRGSAAAVGRCLWSQLCTASARLGL